MFDRPNVNLPLQLDAKDIVFLRGTVAPQPVLECYDVTFEVCPTCASPRWMQTRPDGTGETSATLGDCCDRCSAFRFRHPEVFGFVTTLAQAGRFIQLRLATSEPRVAKSEAVESAPPSPSITPETK